MDLQAKPLADMRAAISGWKPNKMQKALNEADEQCFIKNYEEINNIINSPNKKIYEEQISNIPDGFWYDKFAKLPEDIQQIVLKQGYTPSKTSKQISIRDIEQALKNEFYPESNNLYNLNQENVKLGKRIAKDWAEKDIVQNYHKNTDLNFEVTPLSDIIAEKKFYKSPVYNNRQSSEYSVALDKNGNIYYKRKSNHWGRFFTNVYASDYLKEHAKEFEEFKKLNPELDENDFLESKGFDTSDIYGRIGHKLHNWNLNGGNNDLKKSQSGYILLNQLKNELKRTPDDWLQLAKDLKAGKNNSLKNAGDSVRMGNISPKQKEYIFNEVDTTISDFEKEKGQLARLLHNYDENIDYLYFVLYNKDGNHTIQRSIKIDDNFYDKP